MSAREELAKLLEENVYDRGSGDQFVEMCLAAADVLIAKGYRKVERVFTHTVDLNPDGVWWVTTRRDGEAWSGMPLDHFLTYQAAAYGLGDGAILATNPNNPAKIEEPTERSTPCS